MADGLETELNGHLRNLQHGTIRLEDAYDLLKAIAERVEKDADGFVEELKTIFAESQAGDDGRFPQDVLERARDFVFKFFDCDQSQGLSLAIGGLIHVDPSE